MENLKEINNVNKMKHNTMIPEINPNSYKMLSLDSYQPLQRKTKHIKELLSLSDYKKAIRVE